MSPLNMRKSLFLILFLSAIFACNVRNESSLVGSYKLIKPLGQDAIFLRSDHSYQMIFGVIDSTENRRVENGVWKLQVLGKNNQYISFQSSDPPSNAVVIKPVENWFGNIYLGTDKEGDGSRLYKKVD